MSLEEKAKAAGEQIKGKAQEKLGNITGDPETKAEGQENQTKGEARQTKEYVKDTLKDAVD
ncbi:MAG: CsbD family protein [Chroococcidiopsidaceae cyanobacterium CP_BM_RX_35]|nr:CsbD family protein [Chroococcidiopsidaceae cyanobacterium CP_BM_RX_35]